MAKPNYAVGTGGYDNQGKPTPQYLQMGGNRDAGQDRWVKTPYNFETKASKKAGKEYKRSVAQAKTYAEQNYQYQKSEQALRQGMAGVDKAYEQAKLQSGRGAEMARQTVRQEGQAAAAAASQSMMNRGLYGTSVQDQAQRAVTSDMARNLGMIDAAMAAEQGQLGISQATARAAGLGGIAALYPQLAGMQTDTLFKFMEAFRPPPPKPNFFSQLGAGLGQGLGMAAGSYLMPGPKKPV